MKKILLALALFISFISFAGPIEAKTVRVKSYYKPSTGTFVSPSYRTSPNKSTFDNYSTKGNYNTYSGKKGSVSPYKW